ncbi:TPA: alpha/beta hydrolase [Bacillus cereus]|nr:alpha/beta hydrolase [Bacillus cereus]OPA18261.1 lipase [Bacillus cereus]PEY28141.1 alpha/beta hydrolase [Bacillus anthracis]HDU9003237.1 alpha/beta hydrolase [Bacillus cereus]HDV8361502.1 alpha/beta hydrolase [Bacillus cereus]
MKNRVHPKLLPALEMIPDFELHPENLPAMREQAALILPDIIGDESLSITEEIIEGPDANPLRLKIYRPKSNDQSLPALLWIHGGGYILGSADENDILCVRFAKEANCMVVNVDYRLAPEHPYPAPIEDCYAALKWMADNAEALNIDSNRIGVAGASAGGGLTAALTILARDRQYPSICFQMPLYPMIDDRNNTPSANEIKEGFTWNQKTNEAGWKMYLGELHGTDHIPAYAAAARAEDYRNLPRTYTCVGQLDAFRSETLTYVTKLTEAGVDVEFHLYPGAYHGFEMLPSDADITIHAWNDYVRAVKTGLAKK